MKSRRLGGFSEREWPFPGSTVFQARRSRTCAARSGHFFTNAMPAWPGRQGLFIGRVQGRLPENWRHTRGPIQLELQFRFPRVQNAFGQREAIERMWPGGKTEFDYAVKGNRLYLGNPDRMIGLLRSNSTHASSGRAGRTPNNTALVGRPISRVDQANAGPQPGDPRWGSGKSETMAPTPGTFRFRVDLDRRMSSRAEIPFKILEAIRQFLRSVQ